MILGGGGDTNTDQPAEPTVYDFSTAFEGGEVDQTIADEFSKMLNGVGATQEQAGRTSEVWQQIRNGHCECL